MIEKTHQYSQYQDCTDKLLNDKIMALYDQIEKATICNLQIAQKNSELQIQISTIENVIKRQSATTTPNSYEECQEQDIKEQYGMLLNEHFRLVERVSKIEELLLAKKENQPVDRNYQNTLQRTSSIQNMMKNSRKKTIEKIKYEKRNTGSELTNRRDQTARKKYY